MVVDSSTHESQQRSYWRAVLRRTVLLLAVWFAAGPLLGILLVERLNGLAIGGTPLGFWVAQQGAIYVFVVLIFLYAWLSERADRDEAGAVPRSGAAGGGLAPDAASRPEEA